MSAGSRVLGSRVAVAGSLLALVLIGLPRAAPAAVGDALATITPTAATTVDGTLVDPNCDSQGGSSMAIVQGSKLAGVDPVQYPVLLGISCLDNGGGATAVARRNRLNFLDPATGNVVKSISTKNAPDNGWAHWVNRPDKGDLLACGSNGAIYSIVYSQFDSSQKIASPATAPTLTAITGTLSKGPTYFVKYTYITEEGETLASPEVSKKFTGGGTTGIRVTASPLPPRATGIAVYISTSSGTETKQGVSSTNVFDKTSALVAGAALPTTNTTGSPGSKTLLARPSSLPSNCGGLAWDPEEDMIYQGVTGGSGVIDVHRFKDGTTALLGSFNTECTPSGLAITGGVLLVACEGKSTILRRDKNTGNPLTASGTLGVLGLSPGTNLNPDLGDLACDPVTFQNQFKDAMWSRNGFDGNGVVALKFPPFTCGLPSNATPLWAGLSASPGTAPLTACFNAVSNDLNGFDGNVKDSDGDGLPDCWEDGSVWADAKPGIDFNGDGVRDLQLCVMVDTNGDGTADTEECVDPNKKDVLVEIDYMQFHKPDPLALSQTQSVNTVGVKSIREAFAAAPVDPLGSGAFKGIAIHFQVDEQVTFTTLAGGSASHVSQLVFTPCTGPASFAANPSDAADFDTIKKANFGTAGERNNADLNAANRLNAKRLAFHYALFGHNQVGSSPGAGSSASGCSEVGGDDVAITLGSFTVTSVPGEGPHGRGLTDQQAGTLMHELGHNFGLRHGGDENVNCKPNYLSVMSYTRQFAGSPIPNRRLDYSRTVIPGPTVLDPPLNEASLDELAALGPDPSLGPLLPFFTSADQTAFGPNAWTVAAANAPLNWDKDLNPGEASAAGDINLGPTGGCDGSGTLLRGHDDWSNLNLRFSAALDFAGGGVHSATIHEHVSISKDQAEALFLDADLDGNGVGDGRDCGTFLCEHGIDIKPADPTNTIGGNEATVAIAIYSESDPSTQQVWDAPALVVTDVSLKLTGGAGTVSVVVNQNGRGTCSARDVAPKDGIKDLICHFPASGSLVPGTQAGVVTGFFLDQITGQAKGFQAKQEVTYSP